MHAAHDDHHAGAAHGSLKSYLAGFILSIILTVIPFWMVMHPGFSPCVILSSILALALVQILVHLVCFLHMNGKSEQRWNTIAFVFALLIAALLVGGSVWIINNTTNNLMPVPDLTHQE